MLKKKLLKWVVTPLIAIAVTVAFSSFTGEDEGGGSCDLCVVKENNVTLFSCKVASNSTCSKERTVNDPVHGTIKVKVSCEGAVAC
jgi:hypothetical protein